MDQLNANNHVAGPNTNEGGRQVIEQTLEGIIENLRRFTITIEEYTSDSQSLVFEKINSLIKQYETLDGMRHLYDVHVPFEIFDFIDQGKNPDLYIKTYLENCLKANEQTKGKIEAIEVYKNELDYQLSQHFPTEYEQYKTTRNSPNNNGNSNSNNASNNNGTNSILHNGNDPH